MSNQLHDPTTIKGWGIDADPKNDPTYPMKKRTDAEQRGYSWERPPLQSQEVEVHHSNERPNITAVFGDSVPPSAVSGCIRRYAFKHSESTYRHWLALMFADRVNMVEGVLDDIRHGHMPNLVQEMGYRADWQYDRKGLMAKCAVGVAALGVAAAIFASRRRR